MALKRDKLIGRARRLYAAGLTRREVANALGVCRSSVTKWAADDKKAGTDWDELRREHREGLSTAVLRRLKARFAEVLAGAEKATGPKAVEVDDRLLKLTRIIESYSKLSQSISGRLAVMEEFADFCSAELGEEAAASVRPAMTAYLGRVRDEADE